MSSISTPVITFAVVGFLIVSFCAGYNYNNKINMEALDNASLLINDICKWVGHEKDTYFGGWPEICRDLEKLG